MTQNSPARLNDSLVGVVRLGSCFIGNVTKLRFFTMWDGEEGHLVALEWSLQRSSRMIQQHGFQVHIEN